MENGRCAPNKGLVGDVKYVSQWDPRFQELVDLGLAPSLEESGFCWLACVDMAISRYVPDSPARHSLVVGIAKDAKNAHLLNTRGGLNSNNSEVEVLCNIIQDVTTENNLPVQIHMPGRPFIDSVYDMHRGESVIYTVRVDLKDAKYSDHTMIVDKVIFDDENYEDLIAQWNPIHDTWQAGRTFSSLEVLSNEIYLGHITVDPEIIIFSPEKLDRYSQLELIKSENGYMQSEMSLPDDGEIDVEKCCLLVQNIVF